MKCVMVQLSNSYLVNITQYNIINYNTNANISGVALTLESFKTSLLVFFVKISFDDSKCLLFKDTTFKLCLYVYIKKSKACMHTYMDT